MTGAQGVSGKVNGIEMQAVYRNPFDEMRRAHERHALSLRLADSLPENRRRDEFLNIEIDHTTEMISIIDRAMNNPEFLGTLTDEGRNLLLNQRADLENRNKAALREAQQNFRRSEQTSTTPDTPQSFMA